MTLEGRELIEAYLEGSPEATETIDGWIRGAASAYYRGLSHEWDDLLQDLRLEIIEELRKDRYRGDATVKTYLWRLVNHSCLDRVRAVRRWRWSAIDESPAIVAQVEERGEIELSLEMSDLLLRVLDRVGEPCRRLWSRIVAGESYREISGTTGVSEGALRVRALRCRQRALAIRERLSGGEQETEGV